MLSRIKWWKGGVALGVVSMASVALAADHLDGPQVTNDPAADLTDVYSWVQGGKIVLALDATPLATAQSKFSDKVQYVFHTTSGSKFGETTTNVDILCTFDTEQKVSCWIGDADFVSGDASGIDGISSQSGKVKVFTGLRDDPFVFNLAGFKDTVATVDAAAPALTFDMAGCPAVDAATSAVLVDKLKTTNGGPAQDFFAGKNVLSIVLELDPSLLDASGPFMSVWASTNKGA
jgi:hypothetical protein